jgi:hypothetical protein
MSSFLETVLDESKLYCGNLLANLTLLLRQEGPGRDTSVLEDETLLQEISGHILFLPFSMGHWFA